MQGLPLDPGVFLTQTTTVPDFHRTACSDSSWGMLAADFDDVRDEEFSPSVATQNSRIDFVLVGPVIAIGTKMTRENLTDKKLADELLVDIRRYSEHPEARHLVCFVYDPQLRVKKPAGLVRDLEKTVTRFETLRVVIAPRGI
jgi:hypothetical protein